MIIAHIHNMFENLTQTEQRIADYILKFPEKCTNMTAKELFFDAFEKIDLSLHERNLPLYFADGYYRGVI